MDPLAYLFGLEQFGIKFGLDNIRAIVARLGHPEGAFRAVHIAGTNGKGSVTAMVETGLRAAGHRTARYTSPHLLTLNERFVIDGRPVDDAQMIRGIEDVREAVEALRAEGTLEVQPTFFEVTTAVAFELFRRASVEVAVIEVGLGGRLDATNVITPEVTAITSIAFDHQLYLGSSLGSIAREKAGIIKPGVPVVLGELDPEAATVIEEVAHACGAEIFRTAGSDLGDLLVGLPGEHQRRNAAVAVRVLELVNARGIAVTREATEAAIARVQWPGRLDWRRLADGREMLLDAAHNPAGAAALAAYLRSQPGPPLPLVFAAMRDKDVAGMFRELLPTVSSLTVTRATNPRSADPNQLARTAREIAPALPVAIERSLPDALVVAFRSIRAREGQEGRDRQEAQQGRDRQEGKKRIVVAGSVFLLGDVLGQLGLHS